MLVMVERINQGYAAPRRAGLGRSQSKKRKARANWLLSACQQMQADLQATVDNVSTGREPAVITNPDTVSEAEGPFEGGAPAYTRPRPEVDTAEFTEFAAPAPAAAAVDYVQAQAPAAPAPAAAATTGGGGAASMLPLLALAFLAM